MREFKDLLDWKLIICRNRLSESFIRDPPRYIRYFNSLSVSNSFKPRIFTRIERIFGRLKKIQNPTNLLKRMKIVIFVLNPLKRWLKLFPASLV